MLVVGLLAGVVTALSPCVLPVLPIVLAGGATGRRPLAIVAGLIASFTIFTLAAAWLFDLLGLPADILRNAAIVLLFVVAGTLLVPRLSDLVGKPFERLGRRPSGELGGGVLLGASLGLVFVPCAGPVLATISVVAAGRDVRLEAIVLTLAYAVGAALPLLAIALAGRRAASVLRRHAPAVRRGSGVLLAGAAVAIALGVDRELQTAIPGYTEALQERIEGSARASRELDRVAGATRRTPLDEPKTTSSALPDFGPAPDFAAVTTWLNSKPLTLAGLDGRVVLIDFWTYSCINCLRTLPAIRGWHERYRGSGLVIVGVHTPEFAFEREVGNVRDNIRRLDVRYPVAVDNDYGTWNAWGNRYWPAKFLIDRAGRVRYYHFGEGEYAETEQAIRSLLAERSVRLPKATAGAEEPRQQRRLTPESYLGFERLARYAGSPILPNREATYRVPLVLQPDELAYGGRWTVERERIVAGPDARLRLAYRASDVHLVLAGRGTVEVLVDGKRRRTVRVAGDRLYTLDRARADADRQLELRFSRGVSAYAFTFG